MHSLPTIVALIAAALLTAPILRHLRGEGFVRENWRGRELPFPAGIAIVAAAVLSLGLCTALFQLTDLDVLGSGTGFGVAYLLGVTLLGLVDDLLSGPPARSRGWRGHGRAVLGGGFSTGALKAIGSLALALYVLAGWGYSNGEYLLAVALLVLTTNLFNLLDLRPGRALKAFVLLGAGLLLGSLATDENALGITPFWAVGPFAAAIVVVGLYDLRERAMLGDTGSNLIGGLAGLWMILTLDTTGQLIALAVVVALTVYGEFRSLSALIERTPLLRQIDSIGRNVPHA